MFRYLPEPASDVAESVDWLHNWITDISVFFIVLICGAMLYFAIRYRKTSDEQDEQTPRLEGNNTLEIIWTAVPTVISIIIGYYGIVVYQDLRQVPDNAMRIDVQAYRWGWNFKYENGKRTASEITVPVDEPVKLVMTSSDVLHSFFIPSMRVKKDAVPGMYSYVSFTANKTGSYQVYCTEYCGTNHSAMLAKIHVVPKAEYARWVNDIGVSLPPVDLGKKVYVANGCNACHSLDGSGAAEGKVGPSWLKLYQQEKREFDDGSAIEFGSADVSGTAEAERDAKVEEYIRNSILYPKKELVAGYGAVMASYEGVLTEEEVNGVIAFIKTLDGSAPVDIATPVAEEEEVDLSQLTPVERGERWYKSNVLICHTCHSLDGSRLVGPSFKGLWMKEGELADGSKYVADADYITKAIKYPNDEVVAGYAPAMPVLPVSDEQIADLIEYMKTLQ